MTSGARRVAGPVARTASQTRRTSSSGTSAKPERVISHGGKMPRTEVGTAGATSSSAASKSASSATRSACRAPCRASRALERVAGVVAPEPCAS